MGLKEKIFLVAIILLIGAAYVYAATWQSYSELTSGNLDDADEFMVNDTSDTTANAAGTLKRHLFSSLKTELGLTGIEFMIDGGGTAITTGIKGDLEIPVTGTIQRATCLCDQSGSIMVDIWVDTYANYPPTDADSITASAPITVTTATNSQDSTLTVGLNH